MSKHDMSSSHILLISIGVASIILAAACGDASTASPESPSHPAQTRAATETVFSAGVEPIAQTDPALISSDSEILIANQVYDYLVDITPDNQIAPRLATDWTISDDGLTYTFTLADGVTFHDGSPFGAQDVVWTFNRLRDPDSGFPTADLYKNIDSIEATGDLEVIFQLTKTNPYFLFDLSDNHALILKSGTKDANQSFNGTGPFVVTDFNLEDRINLVANKDYFADGYPKLDRLAIIFFSDEAASADALRGGQLDFIMGFSTPLFEDLNKDPSVNAIQVTTNAFAVVRLRSDKPPGNDQRVIKALKLATDREALFQLVQGGYGSVGKDSPIGPAFPDYYAKDLTVPVRDPATARDLLKQAGYPDGLKMDLYVPNVSNHPDLAVALKNQWADAGIDINVITEPESVYYGENKWLQVDLGITGWGHRPYPQFYIDVMLTCGAKWNESRFCDQEFDQLAQTAGTSMDQATRVDAYYQMQKMLIERGPIIVPYFFSQFGATSSRVSGLELKPFPGRTALWTVSVQ
jgi:peptide/nickel transport system substrate-binding protein